MKHITTILTIFFLSVKAENIEEYDYIIVGAGTAGSVLLKRLSENPSIKVLVLEAGEGPPVVAEFPAISLSLIRTKYTWNYTSLPSERIAHAVEERSIELGAGRLLGGTAMVNLNIYARGNKYDYDEWARNGAIGWDWKNVFPYFLRQEDNLNPEIVDNGYHGIDGDMPIQFHEFSSPITEGYLEGAKATGYRLGDFNGPLQTVFSVPQTPNYKGRRWSTFQAFIKPSIGRRNLRIITSAFVIKILIDENNCAYGVLYEHKGHQCTAMANHEVIISAGTFGSPKLLMLSGIGPREVLESLQIPMIADLPVGRNLHDHASTTGLQFQVNTFTFADHRITKEFYEDVLLNGKGPLTASGGVDAIGFINSKYNEQFDRPDIEIFLVSGSITTGTALRTLLGPNEELQHALNKFKDSDVITCIPFVARAKSRGTLILNSTDPYEKPLIDLNYFSHPYDIKILIEGMRYCLKLASTEPMRRFGARPLPYVMPGCEKYEWLSDGYLECMAITFPFAAHHFTGTVNNVKGLRVVDASVIPNNIGCHTMAPVMMIADKVSDYILDDYKRNY
ncbi:glucose dehydrogenase [FAD, quinone]-like [Centruroides vittatus]|uniref:glucose dehydrogenase [FAD, quinone]-like n=1 Tax=Centruroides vittatus TaxID=120091 RepID=UPI00350EE103